MKKALISFAEQFLNFKLTHFLIIYGKNDLKTHQIKTMLYRPQQG